nr:hypothetical protein [uncultured Rhodopila sp.]
MLVFGRVVFVGAIGWLMLGPASAGTPVTLNANGVQTCVFPTVNENIEIRDVSADISVSGPPLSLQEVLFTARGNSPGHSQDIWLPVVLSDAQAQIYNLHASVLFFAYADARIELAFTGNLAGQTINLNCAVAGFQGFPN